MTTEVLIDNLLFPVKVIAWILSLPVRGFTWVALRFSKPYDPETAICPGCGYMGEKGSNYKTCRITCVATTGVEKASLESDCLRCSCIFYQPVFDKNVDRWRAPRATQDQATRIREANAKRVL